MRNDRNRERERFDRVERLQSAVHLGAKLSPLVDDPDVKVIFDQIEQAKIEAMIDAKSASDREALAAEVRAWRFVRTAIVQIARSGRDAAVKLETINKGSDYHVE